VPALTQLLPHCRPHGSRFPALVPVLDLTTPLPCFLEHVPTAAAATIRQPTITGFPDRDAIASLEFFVDSVRPVFDEPILPLNGLHPTAGLTFIADTAQPPRFSDCLSSTPAARIPLWRSRFAISPYRHRWRPVHTIDDVQQAIAAVRKSLAPNCPFHVHA
jgi:hypothetical protein